MKKLVLTLTATLACVAAFAQGKVQFKNDSLHLVYMTTDTSMLLPTDVGAAGTAIPVTGALAGSGVQLVADLWAGTSASSLTKQVTATFASGGTPGTWVSALTTTLTGVPAGTDFFQVQVYDKNAGSYAAAAAGTGLYYGESSVFTSVANGSTAYFSIVQSTSPAFSTWAAGTFALDSIGITGAKGAIAMQANVPEPTSLALLGLGAAGMLIFRRRK